VGGSAACSASKKIRSTSTASTVSFRTLDLEGDPSALCSTLTIAKPMSLSSRGEFAAADRSR
jgi:hypothetical protein